MNGRVAPADSRTVQRLLGPPLRVRPAPEEHPGGPPVGGVPAPGPRRRCAR